MKKPILGFGAVLVVSAVAGCGEPPPACYKTPLWFDKDGDTYGGGEPTYDVCVEQGTPAPGFALVGGDCWDDNPDINPGATEVCDGVDNNCNDTIDEGVDEGSFVTYYIDGDGDGYGFENPVTDIFACGLLEGYTTQPGDCDDSNASINPGAVEIYYNGVDEDCIGGDMADVDGDGYDALEVGGTDCNDDDFNTNPDATETAYDGVDQDCDGSDLINVDGDLYDGIQAGGTDCNDDDTTVYPGAQEICDGQDNNCDDLTDEGFDTDGDGFTICAGDCDDNDPSLNPSTIWYEDVDGDGYGRNDTDGGTSGRYVSGADPTPIPGLDGYFIGCIPPEEDVAYVRDSSDCDDSNANTNPSAAELCDGADNNCNGTTDEGVSNTYYRDNDGDTYGNGGNTTQSCTQPTGYVTYAGDCNDTNVNINPSAAEVCDGADNNCNGTNDEGVSNTYYRDNDGDGYGNPDDATQACTQPTGYVTYAGDCNDTNVNINPSAAEVCDGVDNNCNGTNDEGVKTIYYHDNDGDGYGNPGDATQSCTQPTGYVTYAGDCNDSNTTINPSAAEVCDGVDNNCNGQTDEEVYCPLYENFFTSSSDISGWTRTGSTGVTFDVSGGQLRAKGGNGALFIAPVIPYTGDYVLDVSYSVDTTSVNGFGPVVGQFSNGKVLILSWENPSSTTSTNAWAIHECDPTTVLCDLKTKAASPTTIVKNFTYLVTAEVSGTKLSLAVNGRVVFSNYNIGATLKPRPGEFIYSTSSGAVYADYWYIEELP